MSLSTRRVILVPTLRVGMPSATLCVVFERGASTSGRLITAPCFRDRVFHHALTLICEPVFERFLIADTFACRWGKGRVASVERARSFARRHPWFLKLDIRKYFDSIDHAILCGRLGRQFKDRRLLDLFGRIIASYEVGPGHGVPIGSLTSQHLANFYLGWVDRFVKEKHRAVGYVRYMDDFVVWGENRAWLSDVRDRVGEFLERELSLCLKPEPYINQSRFGMDFLGCRVKPSHVSLNRRSLALAEPGITIAHGGRPRPRTG
jgi:RNA-directed DNA polymerase